MVVRVTKFRHILGEDAKKSYNGVPISKNAHESDFCAVNPKFVGIVAEQNGGGAFLVLKADKLGQIDANSTKISKHRGAVYDIRWSPFNDNLIASACDDGLVRLWNITDERHVEPNHDPAQTLTGHGKRVGLLEWHPSAENILASASYDNTVMLWDAVKGTNVSTLEGCTNQITYTSFSADGSQMAVTSKDKKLRVFDTHTGGVVCEGPGHENMKVSRCKFLKDGKIFTAGFGTSASRCCRLYDPRNMSEKLCQEDIDNANGSIFPYYDPDHNLMYLAGKGDCNIRFYELTAEAPYIHYLTAFQSGESQRGLGMMPKRGLDTNSNEIGRAYKLMQSSKSVKVIPLKVPRVAKSFQDDLYPPTAGYEPAITADEFIEGKNSLPKEVDFQSLAASSGTSKGFTATASNGDGNAALTAEIASLKKSVTGLKEQLSERDETIEKLKAQLQEQDDTIAKLQEALAGAQDGDEE